MSQHFHSECCIFYSVQVQIVSSTLQESLSKQLYKKDRNNLLFVVVSLLPIATCIYNIYMNHWKQMFAPTI